MTHIIIPIKDIENKIKDLEENRSIYGLRKAAYLGKLIKTSKQISLEEEKNYMSIAKECAIMNNYDENDDVFLHGVIVGYKQALKDLL